MNTTLPRSFGFGYINPEPHGPIDPTPGDLAMEKFRALFPYRFVKVFSGERMGYKGGNLKLAQKIILENNLPLIVIEDGVGLEIRYVPQIAACYFIMNINNAA